MDKIVIGNETLFSIKAAKGQGGPQLSASTYEQRNHKVQKFQPPHFFINGGLQMLGVVERDIYVNLTRKGFEFDLKGDLVSAIKFDLHGHFDSLTNLGVGGALEIAIGTIDLGPLGEIPFNTGVTGKLDLSVKGSEIKVDLDASFVFAGSTHKLATLHLSYDTKSLLDLAKLVLEKVKEFFVDLFKDAAKWAECVAKEFIEGVKDPIKVLEEFYKLTSEEAKKVWDMAQKACATTTALLAM